MYFSSTRRGALVRSASNSPSITSLKSGSTFTASSRAPNFILSQEHRDSLLIRFDFADQFGEIFAIVQQRADCAIVPARDTSIAEGVPRASQTLQVPPAVVHAQEANHQLLRDRLVRVA